MSQKTDWFPGNVNPVRKGVYERTLHGQTHFSKWDGREWKSYWPSADSAVREKGRSEYQSATWRGLAADPKGGVK